jgi:hypothetical protein
MRGERKDEAAMLGKVGEQVNAEAGIAIEAGKSSAREPASRGQQIDVRRRVGRWAPEPGRGWECGRAGGREMGAGPRGAYVRAFTANN